MAGCSCISPSSPRANLRYRASGIASLVAAATLATGALGVRAEPQATEKGSTTLPVLEITDDTYRATATKSALPHQLTPQSISVTDQETLQMRDADSLNEALRYVPGVTPEIRGGSVTRFDQFTIRGFGNSQNAYDGMQLLFNGWNLQPQIDNIAVQQVEVFKGPTSSLYGNMPPGGFINLIAKSPSPRPFQRIEITTGTHNLKEVSFESKGPLGDALSYSVVGLTRKRDSQAKTAEDERYVFAPSLDVRLGANTLLNLNAYYQKDPSAGIYNTVPSTGSVFGTPYGRLDTDFYAGDKNWNSYEREVWLPGYKLHHDFGGGWTFLHQLRYMDADAYQENTYNTGLTSDFFPGVPGADRTLLRRAYLTDEAATGLTVDNQLAGTIRTGPLEHHLLFGVDYLELDSDVEYEDAATLPLDLFAPNLNQINPATLDFAASGLSSDFDIATDQLGLYLQDQIRLGSWVLLASGRYDEYDYEETGIKYGFPATSKIDQEQFSGRVGILYQFANGWAPYLNFAESFEPVGGSDRNGNTFEPATAEQWEVGVKYDSPDQRSRFTLAAFEITKENDLTRDPNGGPLDLIQSGETRSRGVELESRFIPNENLTLMFNYTYLDVEVTEDNSGLEGKTPVWVADHTASLWTQYDLFEGPLAGLTLGGGVRYVGETELDALNTDTVPDYALVDLAVFYDLGRLSANMRGLSLKVTANNLTDKRYTSCFDRNNCWFGAERTVEVGLRYEP